MILLDTNICIYMINGNAQVRKRSRQYQPASTCISSISVAELLFGAAKSNNPKAVKYKVEEFVSQFSVADFGVDAAWEYGNIRAHLAKRGELIGPLDMLIAAQAVANNCKLITNNVREFQRVPGLVLENWA